MMSAIYTENAPLLRGYLEAGAKPKTKHGAETELHCAAQIGNVVAAELLIAHGADVTVRDSHDRTALHHAVWEGRIEVIELLIAAGAEVNPKKGLGLALQALEGGAFRNKKNDRLATLKLLAKYGVDLNAQNENGDTPLHRACAWKKRGNAIVQFLLAQGARVDISNADGVVMRDLLEPKARTRKPFR